MIMALVQGQVKERTNGGSFKIDGHIAGRRWKNLASRMKSREIGPPTPHPLVVANRRSCPGL